MEAIGVADHVDTEKYHLVWRGAALITLMMAAYLWWTRNFGEGLGGVPVIAGLAAALSFALGALDESHQQELKQKFAKTLLSSVFLVPAYLVASLFMLSWAPVTVLNQGNDPLEVTLSPAESTGIGRTNLKTEKDKPARFHVWATPLGRTFVLKVQGYTRRTIEVAAPVGLTVSPERDLTPQVSLLVRPTADGMVELASGGSLHVYRDQGGQQIEIAKDRPGTSSSLLIGAVPVAIPHDLVEDWRLELAGQQMSDVSRANELRWWKSPRFVKLLSISDELAARQKLSAVIRSASGKTIECGTTVLPEVSGSVADLALHSCGE